MAIRVQQNDGLISGANAYVDAATVLAYAQDRGVDLSAKPTPDVEVALVNATDFLDSTYSFVGVQRTMEQGTQWPRTRVPRLRDLGIPQALKDACCKLAIRSLQGAKLTVDPTVDPSGLVLTSKTTKVGPIESSVSYAAPSGGASVPARQRFPEIESMLARAGLINSTLGGEIRRA